MIIEGNPKELAAMEQFHNGNRQAGLALQEEFAAAFPRRVQGKGSLSMPESLPLSWQLQGMRRHPPCPPGTCAELHAAADQQEA